MSLPHEQARALPQARNFLSELCIPGKIKRVPRAVRMEARRRLKHFPLSWDLERIVAEPGAIEHMEEMEACYREEFWKDIKR
jgi:hypothetical protein